MCMKYLFYVEVHQNKYQSMNIYEINNTVYKTCLKIISSKFL